MIAARWSDIFIFSNIPYSDEKRWYYTRNDAFNLILKSNFDYRKKNDIFFHSRNSSKLLPSNNFNLRQYPQKKLGKYLVWGGRDGAPRFSEWNKNRHSKIIMHIIRVKLASLKFRSTPVDFVFIWYWWFYLFQFYLLVWSSPLFAMFFWISKITLRWKRLLRQPRWKMNSRFCRIILV